MTAAATAPRRSVASFRALPVSARTLIAIVTAGAATAFTVAVGSLHTGEPWLLFAVLAAGATALSLSGVSTGRHHRLDNAIVFLTAAALLLPPELVAFMGLAQHGIDGVRRRYPWFAQLFNVANGTLSALAAWSVHDAIAGGDPGNGRIACGALAAAAALVVSNQALLALMVRLGNGVSLRSTHLLSLESLAVEFAPAVFGIGLMWAGTTNPWLLPVAAAPIILVQRTYTLLGRLTESEERFRAVFESAAVGAALMDLEGRIVSCNRTFEAMLGYGADDMRGRLYWDLLAEDADADRELFAAVVRGERPDYHVERSYRRRSGDIAFGNASVALVLDARDNPQYTLAMVEDTTERVELEAQLRQSQKMEAVGRLAGGIAHDFNNILTAITGYSEVALMRVDSGLPIERHELEEISQAAERAARLTAQLLAFSRKQVMRPQVLDANEVVAEMEAMLRRLIDERVMIEKRLDPQLGSIRVDRGQLQQVLLNLVVNGRDAMPDGGRLTIETTALDVEPGAVGPGGAPHGSYVVLVVADTGVGIAPEILPRIFEPFFTTKSDGTGLGLATVYGVVTQSGGYVGVESTPGEGTTYRVCLPRVQAASNVMPSLTLNRAPAPAGATILIAEDEAVVRTMIREVLRSAGYNVLEAGNGRDAIRIHDLHGDSIDVLLTDVVMPDLSGVELATQLSAVSSGLRTLFISGYAGAATAALSDAPFLQKPFTPRELTAKLHEVLAQPVGAAT